MGEGCWRNGDGRRRCLWSGGGSRGLSVVGIVAAADWGEEGAVEEACFGRRIEGLDGGWRRAACAGDAAAVVVVVSGYGSGLSELELGRGFVLPMRTLR